MISAPSGVRVWIATGHTDMRKGMQSLALQIQEGLKGNPHGGDLYIFRGRRGDLLKILWHDGLGLSLYAKRLDKGRFIWPARESGRGGGDFGGANVLHVGGYRLAKPAAYMASAIGGIIPRHFESASK